MIRGVLVGTVIACVILAFDLIRPHRMSIAADIGTCSQCQIFVPLVYQHRAGIEATPPPDCQAPARPTLETYVPKPSTKHYGSCVVTEYRDRGGDGSIDYSKSTFYDEFSRKYMVATDADADGSPEVLGWYHYHETMPEKLVRIDVRRPGRVLPHASTKFVYQCGRLVEHISERNGSLEWMYRYLYDDDSEIVYSAGGTNTRPEDSLRILYFEGLELQRDELDDDLDGEPDIVHEYTWRGGEIVTERSWNEISPQGETVSRRYYDALGRISRIQEVIPDGAYDRLRFYYGENGQIETIEALFESGAIDSETRFSYDSDDRLVRTLALDHSYPPVESRYVNYCPSSAFPH